MIVLPSDHLIKYNKMFLNTIVNGCDLAEQDKTLVTIGITPDYPETAYGYIKFNPDKNVGQAYEVERFVEKPSLDVAKEYLETEEYLWNSGMFIWKTSTILDNIQKFTPDNYKGLMKIQQSIGTVEYIHTLEAIFPKFTAESIDYGIMEKASDIYIIPGTFGWDDVGSWLAVERIQKSNDKGNVVNGNVITSNSENNIIQGTRKLIATVGIEEMIIVDTEDAMLICNKNSAVDIRKVLDNLKICNREEYI